MSQLMGMERVDSDFDGLPTQTASAPLPTSLRVKAAALSLSLCTLTMGFALGLAMQGPSTSGLKSFSPQKTEALYGMTRSECKFESFGADSVCRRLVIPLKDGDTVDAKGYAQVIQNITYDNCRDYCENQPEWHCYGFEYRHDEERRCEIWRIPIAQSGKCEDASPCKDLPKPLPTFECVARICTPKQTESVEGCAMMPAGPRTVCRLQKDEDTVDAKSSAQVINNISFTACNALCNQLPPKQCYGVEHRNDGQGRCEIWKHEITNIKQDEDVDSWNIKESGAMFECVPRKCSTHTHGSKNIAHQLWD